MKNKLTPKQEKASIKYVECGDKSEAYRHAYNTTNMKKESVWRKAVELFDNVKVAARVEELQLEHRKRHNVTVDSLTSELEEARNLAKEINNPSAAVAAIVAKGKLHGLMIDKKQITNKDGVSKLENLTDEDLAEIVLKHKPKSSDENNDALIQSNVISIN